MKTYEIFLYKHSNETATRSVKLEADSITVSDNSDLIMYRDATHTAHAVVAAFANGVWKYVREVGK